MHTVRIVVYIRGTVTAAATEVALKETVADNTERGVDFFPFLTAAVDATPDTCRPGEDIDSSPGYVHGVFSDPQLVVAVVLVQPSAR
jgi:hypothetical protein|eukprot:30897-Pelagococcus_subviridis.AAC.29